MALAEYEQELEVHKQSVQLRERHRNFPVPFSLDYWRNLEYALLFLKRRKEKDGGHHE